ncbi:hypothetical protein BDA96_05G104100 [Sorghum bicolor]|uniref:Uncharacterized protein n=1 Tax=Sorghum bicolor TaxID=4558 RepID=A0A921QXN5_SORBI|nr:hypothetical protein BDA96_05G104100 [Sorghum bicolor]
MGAFAGAAQRLGCAFGLQLTVFVSLAHSEAWLPAAKTAVSAWPWETPLGFVSLELGRSRRSVARGARRTKVEPPPMTYSSKQTEILREGSKTTFVPASTVCGKRKRNFSEDEMLMLTNMSDAVNNVANALRETGAAYVEDNLYQAVMEMEGYSEDALLVAYGYLLDNKAQARGFVLMSGAHRTLWLRNYLAKHYFM